jgi:hypothetical protein
MTLAFGRPLRRAQQCHSRPALDAVVTLRRGARRADHKRGEEASFAGPKNTDHILHTRTRRRILHISVSSQSSESTFKSKYQIRFRQPKCSLRGYKVLARGDFVCQIDLFFGFICTHTTHTTNSGHAAGYRRNLLRVGSVHLTGHNHQTHIRRQSEARHPGRRRWT